MKNKQRHIAIVYDSFPYPAVSGDTKRVQELISVLKNNGWILHFISTRIVGRRQRKMALEHVDHLHFFQGMGLRSNIRLGIRYTVRAIDRILAIFSIPHVELIISKVLGKPIAVQLRDYWKRYPEGLDRFIADLNNQFNFKAVVVEYIWLQRAIDLLPENVITLLDTHDIQHRRIEEFASRGLDFPLSITSEREFEIFRKFDAIVAIQAEEGEYLRKMAPELKILVVGTSALPLNPGVSAPVKDRLVYIGGANQANQDGLTRFLRYCWPRIISNNPRAELHIYGNVVRLIPKAKFFHVTRHGFISDVSEIYTHADMVINPIWVGTGLKIKTVEALAYGCALITTPKGIEGMPEEVHSACIVVNDEAEFTEAVNSLLKDANRLVELRLAAGEFAKTRLNLDTTYKELIQFLDN